jgi:hypothetical protein
MQARSWQHVGTYTTRHEMDFHSCDKTISDVWSPLLAAYARKNYVFEND